MPPKKLPVAIQRTQLKKALETDEEDQTSRPVKIGRIAHYHRKDDKYYSPKFLSIGPIHRLDEKLQPGEQYKLKLTERYVKRTQKTEQTPPKQVERILPESASTLPESAPTLPENAQILYEKIESNIQQLKDLFTEDAIQGFTDEELSWMLFVDGCSLLQILEKADQAEKPDVKDYQLVIVVQDVLLLENQLPFLVLQLLSGDDKGTELMKTMDKFLQNCCVLSPDIDRPAERAGRLERAANCCLGKGEYHGQEFRMQVTQSVSPTHLLDRLRTNVLGPGVHTKGNNDKTGCSWCPDWLRSKFPCWNTKENKNSNKNKMRTHRNIQELKAAGIKMKPSKSRCLRNICFDSRGLFGARLKLPEIIVDDATFPTLMNLIAYEMCPDFQKDYEICSFVIFMDSLIDHPDDVKELRSAGVLLNALRSDEEVARLFNIISTDLLDGEVYEELRGRIEDHYRNKCNTFMSEAYHTYFSSPWTFLGFLAALLALFLTCIQTWYTICP